MDFKNERLMMSKEEIKNRAKELLNENQVDLITKYMFLEQQCKRQKEVIDRIDKYIKENIYSYYDSKGEKCIEETVFERSANPKELLDILNEGKNE